MSRPLSVISVAMNMCRVGRPPYCCWMPSGRVTVPGVPVTRLMPRSIFIQVKPCSLRSLSRRPNSLGSRDEVVSQ